MGHTQRPPHSWPLAFAWQALDTRKVGHEPVYWEVLVIVPEEQEPATVGHSQVAGHEGCSKTIHGDSVQHDSSRSISEIHAGLGIVCGVEGISVYWQYLVLVVGIVYRPGVDEVFDVLALHVGRLLCPHHGPSELSHQQHVLVALLSCRTWSDHHIGRD